MVLVHRCRGSVGAAGIARQPTAAVPLDTKTNRRYLTHEIRIVFTAGVAHSLLVVLTSLPVLAAVIAAAAGRRRPGWSVSVAAGSAAVSTAAGAMVAVAAAIGATPALSVAGVVWLRVDPVGAVLAPLLAAVATTVLVYARRNLDGDRRAWQFATGASLLLGATMVLVTAARLDVLAAGWVAGSAATVCLCGYRGDPGGLMARRRAAIALGAGDAALVTALALLVVAGADLDLGSLGGDAADGWGLLVGLLLVTAALARAGQLPLPRWLPGTVGAPTPVSALLHAGAVNAGAVLLVRSTPLLAGQPLATTALAAAAAATVVVAWSAMRARPDVKGALAESTSAQMGFMLLSVAAGAPVAALAHLTGHALYKSARFLGAGDAIARRAAARRWAPAPARYRPGPIAAGVLAAAAAAGLWWSLTGDLDAAERWLAAAALAVTAGHAGAVVAAQPPGVAVALGGRVAAAVVGAVTIAWGTHRVLDGAVDHSGDFVPLAPVLAGLAAAAALVGLAARNPALVPRLLRLHTPRTHATRRGLRDKGPARFEHTTAPAWEAA